ncbi:PH domain-containing protein [Candidatus Woesearchaeota archaeon]|nr:PH domain-containing protein [Candidatus Woesearchaeota archaeon]
METQDAQETERLDISPSLVQAYLLNVGKAILLVAALIGAFYFVQYIVGENPFISIFETLGLPLVWVMRIVVACIAAYLVLIIFSTLSLTSYELVFEGDSLTYSYGSFFKVTKSTPVANIVRVNFKEYHPLKIGDIVVGFTGTEEKTLTVQFVSDARQRCELINKIIMIRMERLEQVGEIKMEKEVL